jgi:mRNA-degrading endonuclease YafQ of YafQ-DinJ toxin-antitoxin module
MYEGRVTEQFVRATRKCDRTALRAAIEDILDDPYNARKSHTLSHEWAGFRSAEYSGKERIIYRICEECLQKHQESLHPLDCCAKPGKTKEIVTFIDFGDYHESAGRRRLRPAASYHVDESGGSENP